MATKVNTHMREILKSINLAYPSNSDLLKVMVQLHHDFSVGKTELRKNIYKLTIEGNKNSTSIHSISEEISGQKSTVSKDCAKIPSLSNKIHILDYMIGILEVVNAKQNIIIRELCDQQKDLINCNMRNNILFHNIPAVPMENVIPRQNVNGLYNYPMTTRSIINKFLVECWELIQR